MEISNEIKAKVFAQYLGQRINVGLYGYETKLKAVCEDGRINPVKGPTEYPPGFISSEVWGCALILRPLSAITDEDAIKVAKLGQLAGVPEDKFSVHGRQLLGHYIQRQTNVSGLSWFAILQYLQSKGYDLPHYLLGGKTLKEAGLAIYEEKQLA